jgi:SHS2 domain-containing protein
MDSRWRGNDRNTQMTLARDKVAPTVGWELFSHDADVGVRGFGATVAEAFEGAALALTAAITDAPIAPNSQVEVTCEAGDIELLLVDWLNAIIYEMAVRHMIFGRFTVEIEDTRLRGTLWGEGADAKRHAPVCEPKGATYTALDVAKDADGLWSASCVVDV